MAENSKVKINKKFLIFGVIVLILLVGAYFRFYHVDFPVAGYHNWKETHYLTEARNFNQDGFFENGFFVPERDYPDLATNQLGVHGDTFPTTSVLAAFSFKIFGETLFAARLVGILCSLASVYLMFLIVRKMFKRDDIAYVAAALTAINPLLIFFSRNVQLMAPALLFMLLGWYYFLDWRESLRLKTGILTVLFLMLSLLTKYSFFVILIPILATFPYKRVIEDIKPNVKNYLLYVLMALPLPLWFIYSRSVGKASGVMEVGGFVFNFGVLFTSGWFSAMKSYISDNFTLIGFSIAILGLMLIALINRDHFGNKFTLYYAAGLVPWLVLMGDKLGQHSYHQTPIAPLMIILMSFALVAIGTNLAGIVSSGPSRNYSKYGILLLMIVLLIIPSATALSRQFDTQFLGLDVAGDYIKEHSTPEERILFSRGQSFGVLWHADRKGYGLSTPTLEQVQQAEERGVTWIFMYQWGLNTLQDSEVTDYITSRYSMEQVGFLSAGQNSQLVYILLKKGGTFTIDEVSSFPSQHKVQVKTYEFSKGIVEFSYASK